MPETILFAWSGGKDSALALRELQRGDEYKVTALLTTVTKDYDRISMHGVRSGLLEEQADSLALALEKVYISKVSSNEEYAAAMEKALKRHKELGVSSVAFGDIFLEDLRKYREENLSKVRMKGVFPIWKKDTGYLASSFVESGFKAVITCVDTKALDKSFAGREFDEDLISSLPPNVDLCGENGEFHSFVYDGPIFRKRILFERGEKVLRDGSFYYCDLVPK